MTVDEMSAYSRTIGLIRNRVKIVNQLLGYNSFGSKVPCVYAHAYGVHLVSFCGASFARFDGYDQIGADHALERLDALIDGLWYGLGGGVVRLA